MDTCLAVVVQRDGELVIVTIQTPSALVTIDVLEVIGPVSITVVVGVHPERESGTLCVTIQTIGI